MGLVARKARRRPGRNQPSRRSVVTPPRALVLQKADLPAAAKRIGPRLTGEKAAVASLGGIVRSAALRRALARSRHYQVGYALPGREIASSAFVFSSEKIAREVYAALRSVFPRHYQPLKAPDVGDQRIAGRVVAAALQQVIIVRSDRVIWSVSALRFTSVAAGDRAYAETVALARKQAKRVP